MGVSFFVHRVAILLIILETHIAAFGCCEQANGCSNKENFQNCKTNENSFYNSVCLKDFKAAEIGEYQKIKPPANCVENTLLRKIVDKSIIRFDVKYAYAYVIDMIIKENLDTSSFNGGAKEILKEIEKSMKRNEIVRETPYIPPLDLSKISLRLI